MVKKRLTQDAALRAFLKDIKSISGWHLTGSGRCIRNTTYDAKDHYNHCPLSCVANLVKGHTTVRPCEITRPAGLLGFSEPMGELIADAADYGFKGVNDGHGAPYPYGRDARVMAMRKKLLKAAGLQEEAR